MAFHPSFLALERFDPVRQPCPALLVRGYRFGGEREGFIPLSKMHELQRFSNIPEYPYLRKYLAEKTPFKRVND
jgi:hypothetical protein